MRDTIEQLEATRSQLITDGEQTKPSFATYPLTGLENLAPDGVEIPFEDGHVRQLPRLTAVHSATALTPTPTSSRRSGSLGFRSSRP